MEELRDQKLLHDNLRREVEVIEARAKGNGHADDPARLAARREALHGVARRIRDLVDQIGSLGAEVKDLDRGLLDFRALVGGREVYLCWRLGEDRIAWWHTLEGGFAGRQPL